jgi:hypothetical protein
MRDEWKRYAEEYLVDYDRVAAYRRVYGDKSSPATVHTNSYRLFRSAEFQAYIEELRAPIRELPVVNALRLVEELTAIALANMGDFFDSAGGEIVLKDKKALTARQLSAVQEISSVTTVGANGSAKSVTKVRIFNKIEAIKELVSMLGYGLSLEDCAKKLEVAGYLVVDPHAIAQSQITGEPQKTLPISGAE